MDPKYLRDKNEEEIDIIELLKRVKEGNAPRRIMVDKEVFEFYTETEDLFYLYHQVVDNTDKLWLNNVDITFDTKIKILDKPIIEELDENENVDIYELARKVNQIIKHINKEEK